MSDAPARKHRRLGLYIPWALFAAAVLGWVIYWHVLAGAAQRQLADWAAEQTAAGGEARFGAVSTHGFPRLMRLRIADARWRPPGQDWRVETAAFDLNINMTNPAHLMLKAAAPIALTQADGERHDISAATLLISYRAKNGALAQAGIEADQVIADNPARDGELRAQKLVANLRPDPRAPGEYQAALELTNAHLARPVRAFEAFGQDIPRLQAGLVLERGAALLEGQDRLANWGQAGGRVRIEGAHVRWGALEGEAHGAIALDANRRLAGALDVRTAKPAPVILALAENDQISDDARAALALVAAAFAFSGDDAELDVKTEDGALYVEGARVRTLEAAY